MNTMTTTTIRVTKANRFSDIKSLLVGDEPDYGTTIEEAFEFLDKEIERANKKRTPSTATTEEQIKREEEKGLILDLMATWNNDPDNPEGVTCTDIRKNIPLLSDYNTSKISSLTSALVREGKIVRMPPRKGRTPFKLA